MIAFQSAPGLDSNASAIAFSTSRYAASISGLPFPEESGGSERLKAAATVGRSSIQSQGNWAIHGLLGHKPVVDKILRAFRRSIVNLTVIKTPCSRFVDSEAPSKSPTIAASQFL